MRERRWSTAMAETRSERVGTVAPRTTSLPAVGCRGKPARNERKRRGHRLRSKAIARTPQVGSRAHDVTNSVRRDPRDPADELAPRLLTATAGA